MRFAAFMLTACSLLLSGAGLAQAAQFIVLIDGDQNVATGCRSTLASSVNGIEYRIIVTVDDAPNPTHVESVTLEQCQSGSFSSPTVVGGGQALGIDNGLNGADVIEFAINEALIPEAASRGGASALLQFASNGSEGPGSTPPPVAVDLNPSGETIAIPSLSSAGVLALSLLMALFGWRHRGRAGHVGITLVLLCTSGGLLIAAQFAADGRTDDWIGIAPLIQNAPGNPAGSRGVDIVAVFVSQQAGRIYFRLDVRNISDGALEVPATSFSIAENSPAGTVVGTIAPANTDGANLRFSITAGNGSGAFVIDPISGQLTVAAPAALDFEQTPLFQLAVQVTDDQTPQRTGNGTITVSLTDVNEAPVLTPATFSIAENSPAGTVVGSLTLNDPDNGQNHGFAITGGNSGNTFTIEAESGLISVDNPALLDATSHPSFTLTVTATDNGSPALDASATVTITVTATTPPPAPNQSPTLSDASFNLDEHSAIGTLIGTLAATDPDLPGQTLTYAITGGNSSGAFALNALSGALMVADADALDFESSPSFALTVTVSDNGSPVLSDSAVITISLNDVNDAPVVQATNFSVDENAANGTLIGTVAAADADQPAQTLSYAIIDGNSEDIFALDAATGELTVVKSSSLDFETAPAFALTIAVSDDQTPPATGTGIVTVNLNDINETPSITSTAFSIAEHSTAGSTVGTLTVNDPDNGQTHSFAIVGGNTDNTFALQANTGLITVADPAGLSAGASFALSITSTDNGNPPLSSTATVTISVTDLNDPPSLNDISFSLDEHSANGTLIGTLSASDPDLPGQTLSYAITGGNDSGAFAIDAATGAITVANATALDYESTPSFDLIVTVTDNGSPALSDSATVTINLNDLNDAPVVQEASFTIAERATAGTQVGTVAASDADLPAQALSYAITAGNTGTAFAIDAGTGVLTVANASALDHATTPSFTLTITVTDNGTPARSGNATVTVALNNVNDAPAPSGGPFAVAENSLAGTPVGTVLANDPDSGQSHSFTITGGDGATAFSIDTTSGQITVSGNVALNFESKASYTLEVQVTDNASPPLSASATVSITLTDVNEAPAISDASFSVAENSANGTLVGTIPVTDPDAGQSHSYTIVSGNTSNAYAINAAGQITVANSAALDYENAALRSLTLTIQVTDNGTPAMNDTAVVTINLSDQNEAPNASAKTYSAHTNLPINIPAGSGLLLGSTDPEGESLKLGNVSASTPVGAIIDTNLDGSFSFTPPPGVTGAVTFTFEVCDAGNLCDAGTATVTVSGPVVWFVNHAAADGGNGTQTAPFKTLGSVTVSENDRVFVFAGTYDDGLILQTNSRLIGQGANNDPDDNFDTLLGLDPLPAHANPRPTLMPGATTTIGAVSLGGADNVVIRGVSISAGSITAFSADGSTGLDVAHTSIAASGASALDLKNTSGSMLLLSTSSDGGINNVLLSSVSGTIALGNGALSGATGAAISISGSSANVGYAGSVSSTTQGVVLTNNINGTISLSGPLALNTGSSPAFTATGGGTIQAAHAENSLSTTSATALKVVDTTIGSDGLRFKRIESSGGVTPGIELKNTGTTAGLTVLGSGTAGSGGTIENKTVSCISVENSRALDLRWMKLQACQGHGLDARNLTNFSLTDSTVSNNGNGIAGNGLNFNGLYGNASIIRPTISGSASNNLRILNSSGTLTQLNITGPGCTFSNTQGASGNDGIQFSGEGNAIMAIAVSNCTFSNHRGDHFQAATSGTLNATMTVSFEQNTLGTSGTSAGGGIAVAGYDGTHVTATIRNNDIDHAVDSAIKLYQGYSSEGLATATSAATFTATVERNLIGSAFVGDSGSAQGDGLSVQQRGNGTLTTLINDNDIRQYANAYGIHLRTGSGNGIFNATVTNNVVGNPGTFARNGFYLKSGILAADYSDTCLSLSGNTMASSGKDGAYDIELLQLANTPVQLGNYLGAATDLTAVQSHVSLTNTGSVRAIASTGAGYGNASGGCPLP